MNYPQRMFFWVLHSYRQCCFCYLLSITSNFLIQKTTYLKKHSLIFVWAAYIYYSFVISNDLIIFILSLFPTKTKRGYFANYNAMSHCSVSKISERVISPLASMSHTFDTFFAGVLSQSVSIDQLNMQEFYKYF